MMLDRYHKQTEQHHEEIQHGVTSQGTFTYHMTKTKTVEGKQMQICWNIERYRNIKWTIHTDS